MWFKAASYDGKVNAREAMTLLKLELRMLRAAPKDIDTGIKTIRRLRRAAAIRPTLAGELYSIESIFLKQRATAIALQGNVARSRQLQRIASAQLLEAIRLRNEDIDSDEFSSRRYRLMALESRFSKYGKPALSLNDVKAAVSRAADTIFPDALLQLADVELAGRNPTRYAERIFQAIEQSAGKVGYRQDVDFSIALAVRRRWWELQIHQGLELRADLLESDVQYWTQIGMANEIRGLQLASLRNADVRDAVSESIQKATRRRSRKEVK